MTNSAECLAGVEQLYSYLRDGRGVGIHCRMGIGRSSMLTASLMVKSGLSPKDAFVAISRDRGIDVPDTNDQIEWVESMRDRLQTDVAE
jgi:protein-tyrosine phosphatase